MQPPANRPNPIRTDGSNAFAYNTMRVRLPNNIRNILEANPDYPESIQQELAYLHRDVQYDGQILPLSLFPAPPPDYQDWMRAYLTMRGGAPENELGWLSTEWFYAETFVYRTIVEAVRWWETGRDPFAPIKQTELDGEALWNLMNQAASLEGGVIDRIPELLKFALWGNRIDLSYAAAAELGAASERDDEILRNDAEQTRDHLISAQLAGFPGSEQGIIHIIADNAGTELAMDLVLADALLSGCCDICILHLKYHPTFVSDAIPADAREMISRLVAGNHGGTSYPNLLAVGKRLQEALDSGRLRLAPHFFWNSSRFMWDMPGELAHVFENALLVILKGDANYRRAVGDAIWPADTPFESVVGYFPAPFLALRTLKSDPIIGLSTGQDERLDHITGNWRVSGKYGVIQLKA